MIYECEQCDGSGWIKGQRCPCREEDDKAEERRSRIRLVSSGRPVDEPLGAGQGESTTR